MSTPKPGGVPVRIVSYKPLGKESALRGFLYIRQEGQQGFVSPPQITSDVNGEKKYFPVLKWPRAWGDCILAELEAFIDETAVTP